MQNKIQGADKNLDQKKYEITFEKVARDLQKIQGCRQWRMGPMGRQYKQSWAGRSLQGLMVDKKEIKHGRIDQMDRSEVEARLMALLEKNDLAPKAVEDEAEEDVEDLEGDFEDAEWEVIEDEDLPDDLEDETEGEG